MTSQSKIQDTISALVDSLRTEIAKLKPPVREPIETVKELRDNLVGHHQIAQMYGFRNAQGFWIGPFFDDNGSHSIALIEREAANPGSVIRDGFEHPRFLAQLQSFRDARASLREQLLELVEIANDLAGGLDADTPALDAASDSLDPADGGEQSGPGDGVQAPGLATAAV